MSGWHFSFGKRRDGIRLIVGAVGIKSLKNAGSGTVELSHFQGDTLQLLAASGQPRLVMVDRRGVHQEDTD